MASENDIGGLFLLCLYNLLFDHCHFLVLVLNDLVWSTGLNVMIGIENSLYFLNAENNQIIDLNLGIAPPNLSDARNESIGMFGNGIHHSSQEVLVDRRAMVIPETPFWNYFYDF